MRMFTVFLQPPYSPDKAHCDFILIPEIDICRFDKNKSSKALQVISLGKV